MTRKGVCVFLVMFALPAMLFAAGSAPQPSICNRGCWSARSPQSGISYMSGLNRAVIHHTAGASDFNTTSLDTTKSKVRAIQNYHMDSLGWTDIGYHFLIDKLGNKLEGRYASMSSYPRGAHDGTNTNSFGFSNMGYFHTPYNHQPPTVMRNACYDLIAWRIPNPFTGLGGGYYAGLSNRGYVCGHRDVGSTACPGDIWYGYIGTNLSGGEARTAINQRIVGTHSTIIVDNANAGFTCSANWATGTSSTDKYGTNYRWRSTQAISDTAQFSASLPSSGTWTVYAWWPQGTNRTPTAPYIVYYSSGSQTKSMNQQVNGGKWNTLGSWSMNSGSNKVKISCWTGTGYVIMADAVKWYK